MNNKRQLYIDNLRLLVIVLVVLQHLAVTYSGFGDWYYKEPSQLGIVQTVVFGLCQAHIQAFTMGLMFLLAGYFTPDSYDKKGFFGFVGGRLYRLCIPTLLYMLVINPFIIFCLLRFRIDGAGLFGSYTEYITGLHFISGTGPLWFALALLIFSVFYAIVKKTISLTATKAIAAGDRDRRFPPFTHIVVFIAVISLFAFLLRLVAPIGSSVSNMQLCYFAQYMLMYIIGIVSRRNDWFNKLRFATGRRWLICGITLGAAFFAAIMVFGGGIDGDLALYEGGFTWQSAAFSLWESFVALSLSIGLIAVFKEKYNKQRRLIQLMSSSAFSVYVFHPLIVVALTGLFAPLALLPIVKFALAALICLPLCFAAAHLTIRQIPLLRTLFE